MTPDELEELLSPRWETRLVECKAAHAFDRNSWLTQTALRACLGLANESGGGHVVIGIGDDGTHIVWNGFEPDSAELKTWTYDAFGDFLRAHADPTPRFEVRPVTVKGKVYVVIRVFEFEDVPIICAKETQQVKTPHGRPDVILERGMLYVRGDGRAETRRPHDSGELRRVIELAMTKGLTKFVERASTVGLRLGPPKPSDQELFAREREASSAWQHLHAPPGGWFLSLRPTAYRQRALPDLVTAEAAVQRATVHIRGGMPRVEHGTPLQREQGSTGLDREQFPAEIWRMFLSGQFVHFRAIIERIEAGAPDSGKVLFIDDPLLMLYTYLSFAQKLAVGVDIYDRIAIEVRLSGLRGRRLLAPPWRDFDLEDAVATAPEFVFARELDRGALVAETKGLALEGAKELLALFNIDAPEGLLEESQRALIGT